MHDGVHALRPNNSVRRHAMNTFNQIFLKRLRSKTAFGLLLTCFLAMVVSGCFQATNKFYFDSDITTDKRFEGRFGANSTTHDTNQAQSPVSYTHLTLPTN